MIASLHSFPQSYNVVVFVEHVECPVGFRGLFKELAELKEHLFRQDALDVERIVVLIG